MASTGEAVIRRTARITMPRLTMAIIFAVGLGLGAAAGRLSIPSTSANVATSAVTGSVPADSSATETLLGYRAAQASLASALENHDVVAAARFRAQLRALSTPAVVSALAHARVDLGLGLAAATARHDPPMVAEFRSRLADAAVR